MNSKTIAVVVTVAFSVVGVLGDYFLKRASSEEDSLRSPWFYLGFALYASTAFGWVFVMKHLKLATIGVLYSVSMVVLLTAVGVGFFASPSITTRPPESSWPSPRSFSSSVSRSPRQGQSPRTGQGEPQEFAATPGTGHDGRGRVCPVPGSLDTSRSRTH